jgi:hypothetical protein
MQGKASPLDVDVKFRLEPFNTPGTEVAPRSDVEFNNIVFADLLVGHPTDMVEYLSTEKPIHTQEKRVDDFHRAFG